MTDREVIEAFIAHLRDHGFPGLKVDRWPEDENRYSKGIDALAGPLAIEHTSVDPLPDQRLYADWFLRAVGDLEAELRGIIPFRLEISIGYHAVDKGQNWSEIKEAIKNWITRRSPYLPDESYVFKNLPGVPFQLWVTKDSKGAPGVFFSRRMAPKDDKFVDRIRQQFERKAIKLAKYQGCSCLPCAIAWGGGVEVTPGPPGSQSLDSSEDRLIVYGRLAPGEGNHFPLAGMKGGVAPPHPG